MEITGNTFFFQWEVNFMQWLQSVLSPAALEVVSFFSAFGEEIIMIMILGFVYWSYDKELGRYIGFNLLIASVWNFMMKNLFLRRRPYFDHAGIKILRVVEPEAGMYDIAAQGYSFPSGHATEVVSVYGSIAVYTKKRLPGVIAFLLPLLVGFSRVAVGAHYPTDVLAGWVIGIVAIIFVPWLYKAVKNRILFYIILLLLTVPGFFYCKSNDYFTSMGMLIGFIVGTETEEKFVKFKNTRSPIRMILRVVCGGAVFIGLNTLLKMPFSSSFAEGGSYAALTVRCVRYAVIMFVEIAVYPAFFRLTDKKGRKRD